jgi:hypothetical protein
VVLHIKSDRWEWDVPIGWDGKKATKISFQNRKSALIIEESEKIVPLGVTISQFDLNLRWEEGHLIVTIGMARFKNADCPEESGYESCGLTLIVIPLSVIVLNESSFYLC